MSDTIQKFDSKTQTPIDFSIGEQYPGKYNEIVDFPGDLRAEKSLCAKITCGVKNTTISITLPTWIKYFMITSNIPSGIINGNSIPGNEVSLNSAELDYSQFGVGQYIWDSGSPNIRQLDKSITSLKLLAYNGGDIYYVNIA